MIMLMKSREKKYQAPRCKNTHEIEPGANKVYRFYWLCTGPGVAFWHVVYVMCSHTLLAVSRKSSDSKLLGNFTSDLVYICMLLNYLPLTVIPVKEFPGSGKTTL